MVINPWGRTGLIEETIETNSIINKTSHCLMDQWDKLHQQKHLADGYGIILLSSKSRDLLVKHRCSTSCHSGDFAAKHNIWHSSSNQFALGFLGIVLERTTNTFRYKNHPQSWYIQFLKIITNDDFLFSYRGPKLTSPITTSLDWIITTGIRLPWVPRHKRCPFW